MKNLFNSKRIIAAFAAACLIASGILAGAIHSYANQSNTWSPTTGIVNGVALSNNYNNAFSAIQSCNSGGAAPTNDQTAAPVQGQCWLNTSTSPFTLQQYDGTQWLTVGWLDTINHQWILNTAGGIGTVASATTTDLCATSGVLSPNPVISIIGNATINGFGSTCQAGTLKLVAFTGSPILVHNATSFFLPNAGFNISVSPGDSLVAVSTGSGNWRVVSYQQASGLGGIPSGTEAPFAGITPASGWTLEAGQALGRSANPNLFNAITSVITGTPANGSATINSVSVDLRNLGVEGAFVEGTGIPIGAFISSVTSTTITMNTTATGGTGGETIRILPWGQGDASTTFNVPDRRGIVLAGRDNMGGTAASRLTLSTTQGILGSKLGAGVAGGNIGGEQAHTQTLSELVAHTHNFQQASTSGAQKPASAGTAPFDTNTTTPTSSTGSGSAFNVVMPSGITNYIIKN